MAVRGVYRTLEGQFILKRRDKLRRCIINVRRPQRTAGNVPDLTEIVTQMPTDKTAFVLDLIALGLRQFGIFLCGFRRAYRRLQPFADVVKRNCLV